MKKKIASKVKNNQKEHRDTRPFPFWRNFKLCRVEAGLKQSEAANKLGIYENVLSNIENNRTEPPLIIILKMVKVYKVSLESLLTQDLYGQMYEHYCYLNEDNKSKPSSFKKFYRDLDASMSDYLKLIAKSVWDEITETDEHAIGIYKDDKGNLITWEEYEKEHNKDNS